MGVMLPISGASWLSASAISRGNEFAFNPPVPLGTAHVVRPDSAPPDRQGKRPSFVIRHPFFVYFAPRQVKRELSGKRSFGGYFEIGADVRMGQTRNREVILDAWYRPHDSMWPIFLASLSIGFGAPLLCLKRTKKVPAI